MIGNYLCRFELRPGKFVYVQAPQYRTAAVDFLSTAKFRWQPPPWYYHLAKGGHVAALREHTSCEYHAALDVADFFGSVTKSKLIRRLKAIGYSFVAAAEFAADSTVWIEDRFALPYGFVQSPYLATLALAESALGRTIRRVRRSGVIATVYMDDIILSDNSTDALSGVMEELSKAAAMSSFRLNDLKRQEPQHVVRAYNILLSKDHLEITGEKFLDFRGKVIANVSMTSVNGVIGYVRTVNSAQAERLEGERI